MSLNQNLFEIAKHQKENDFFGKFDIKRTFHHAEITSRVTIVIDVRKGTASKVIKHKRPITVYAPCALESLSRSNGNWYPYALHDKLKYLIPSTGKYRNIHKQYVENLKDWVSFSGSKKLKALLKFIERGTLASDLDDNDIIPNQDMFVTFSFMEKNKAVNPWEDVELVDSYISYYESKLSETVQGNACAITGSSEVYSYSFPNSIGEMGGKYLSAKDEYASVWRGRFQRKDEVVGISARAVRYISWALGFVFTSCSEKIIKREKEDNIYFALAPVNFDIKLPIGASLEEILTANEISGPWDEGIEELEDKLLKELKPDAIMIFLSAKRHSTGRMAILEYQEYRYKEIKKGIRCLVDFYRSTSLMRRITYYKKTEEIPEPGVKEHSKKDQYNLVSFNRILNGTDSVLNMVNDINHTLSNGDYFRKEMVRDEYLYRRILCCAWDGHVPTEIRWMIEDEAIERQLDVSNRTAFVKKMNVLCALLRMKRNEHKKSPYDCSRFVEGRLYGLRDLLDVMARNSRVPPMMKNMFGSELSISRISDEINADLSLSDLKVQKVMFDEKLYLEKEVLRKNRKPESSADKLLGYQYELFLMEDELWRNCHKRLTFI